MTTAIHGAKIDGTFTFFYGSLYKLTLDINEIGKSEGSKNEVEVVGESTNTQNYQDLIYNLLKNLHCNGQPVNNLPPALKSQGAQLLGIVDYYLCLIAQTKQAKFMPQLLAQEKKLKTEYEKDVAILKNSHGKPEEQEAIALMFFSKKLLAFKIAINDKNKLKENKNGGQIVKLIDDTLEAIKNAACASRNYDLYDALRVYQIRSENKNITHETNYQKHAGELRVEMMLYIDNFTKSYSQNFVNDPYDFCYTIRKNYSEIAKNVYDEINIISANDALNGAERLNRLSVVLDIAEIKFAQLERELALKKQSEYKLSPDDKMFLQSASRGKEASRTVARQYLSAEENDLKGKIIAGFADYRHKDTLFGFIPLERSSSLERLAVSEQLALAAGKIKKDDKLEWIAYNKNLQTEQEKLSLENAKRGKFARLVFGEEFRLLRKVKDIQRLIEVDLEDKEKSLGKMDLK